VGGGSTSTPPNAGDDASTGNGTCSNPLLDNSGADGICVADAQYTCGPDSYHVECVCNGSSTAATCTCTKDSAAAGSATVAGCPSCGSIDLDAAAAQCGVPY
jgi:hypothetical protein